MLALVMLSLAIPLGWTSSLAETADQTPPVSRAPRHERAAVTLQQAVSTAIAAIPGQAVEAQLSAEDGRIVYEVEIVDLDQDRRWVYVDAEAGTVVKVRSGLSQR